MPFSVPSDDVSKAIYLAGDAVTEWSCTSELKAGEGMLPTVDELRALRANWDA